MLDFPYPGVLGASPPGDSDDSRRFPKPGYPCREGNGVVYRITLAYFMRLGEELQRLRLKAVEGTPYDQARGVLFSARRTLQEVQHNDVLAHALRASYQPIDELVKAIERVMQTITEETRKVEAGVQDSDHSPDLMLDFLDAWQISEALKKFYAVFSAEIEVANAYMVLRKGGYDTGVLLFTGEELFPPSLISKVPDTLADVRAAGTCLAFELGTACGFHVLRAVEAVALKYWNVLSGGKPLPEPRGLGSLLAELKNQKLGDDKAIAALKQIKDLHRNPLMHPEVHLDIEQAIGLVGMAQSAIRAMLVAIPDPPP